MNGFDFTIGKIFAGLLVFFGVELLIFDNDVPALLCWLMLLGGVGLNLLLNKEWDNRNY